MLPGKKKCKILKQIRQEIAKANDIEFVTSECKHKGNCEGTCPKCEEELRYLESELEQRRNAGKKVSVASILAGAILTALPGCMLPKSNGGAVPKNPQDMETDSSTTCSDSSTMAQGDATPGIRSKIKSAIENDSDLIWMGDVPYKEDLTADDDDSNESK